MNTRWILVLIAAGLITLLVLFPNFSSVATSQSPGSPPGPSVDLRIALAEIEVTPQALAACGLQNSASTILGRLTSAGEQMSQLAALRQSLSTASNTATSLSSSLSSHPGDEQLTGQYQTAMASVQSLQAQISQVQQALFETATQGLLSNQIQQLTIFKQSQGRRLPPEFRIKSRTDDQWHAVELAVIAESRAQRLGQPPNSGAAALLTELRSDPEVIAAAASLQAHLAEVQSLIPVSTNAPGG